VGPTRDAGLTADSVHFRRRVRMQGNLPRACRLGAVGVGAEQKRRTGDAIRCGDPAEATRVCRPCFSGTRAGVVEAQPASKRILRFAEESA
jgi:hypothetical protein